MAAHARAQPNAPQPVQRSLLPDRPKLAAGVRPAGQFKESAFVEPPWLIERDGAGYVHVTSLIYRVAELCTGDNDYEAIAQKITAEGTPVQPQTIQRLVGQLLIPRGLVMAPDGSVAKVSGGNALSRINIRTKEIGPAVIDPVTNVLRWLYWPPIMVALLAAAALVEGWLYFIHGVAGGFRDALNYPGFMLIILLFVIVAAAFHEIGHAAAMRYAGAKVNGMGAGLYLVYPAFYTDVTNNYRLGRWQRLRTDLGGFYFNLIFVLAVMGAYAATGLEVLLLVVLMINFEIVHQLLPFLRLDGYWALADVTGVPDFLSQIGAFARQLVPRLRGSGQKMPPLKWWGKAVFLMYVLVSLPLMGVLLFVLVRAAPRVFATAYQSALNLGHDFAGAETRGDGLGMAAALGQLLLLAIPTLGLAYTLILLGKRLAGGLWRWSLPSWPRRASGGLAAAGICVLLVWLWAPALPRELFGSRPSESAYAASGSTFQPIGKDDRGTIQESVSAVWWDVPGQPAGSTNRAPAATPQASTTASPAAQPSDSSQPAPSAADPSTVATAAPITQDSGGVPIAAATPVPAVATSAPARSAPARAAATPPPSTATARAAGTPVPTAAP